MAERVRLPLRRSAETYALSLGPTPVTITLGRRESGALGEIWIDVGKRASSGEPVASAVGAVMHGAGVALARLASLALQHGTPASVVADACAGVLGQPGAVVGHDTIMHAESVPDLVAQLLQAEAGS